VIFLDALSGVAPIHLDWIDSWDAFLAVLEVRFKSLGHSKVKRRKFAPPGDRYATSNDAV
jgi:hypothetical protein